MVFNDFTFLFIAITYFYIVFHPDCRSSQANIPSLDNAYQSLKCFEKALMRWSDEIRFFYYSHLLLFCNTHFGGSSGIGRKRKRKYNFIKTTDRCATWCNVAVTFRFYNGFYLWRPKERRRRVFVGFWSKTQRKLWICTEKKQHLEEMSTDDVCEMENTFLKCS